MKKLDIAAAGLQPLTKHEETEITGGWIVLLKELGKLAVAAIIADWDNFKNGLAGRPEKP